MDKWTAMERVALLASILVHVLLGWALSQLLQRRLPSAEPSYMEVVFLPPRAPAPGPVLAPAMPARTVVAAAPRPRALAPTPRTVNVDASLGEATMHAAAPALAGTAAATATPLDLTLHTPDVVLIPARAPWERTTTLERRSTRFARHWREPKSISQVISGLLPPDGIKDPAQLCSDAERLMQKRGCDALFNRADPMPEELP